MKQRPQLIHTSWPWALAFTVMPSASAIASPMGHAVAARVSQDSCQYYLDDMLYAHDGDNRGAYGPEHDLARDNVAMLMSSFGWDVTLEPFEYNGDTFYNVVATKTGMTHPEREYVVGAHYDSVDNPGADDNASGVALVLETARVLSEYESDSTIRLVAFDLEDVGLGWYGSYAYVADHGGDDIQWMISADMVAWNGGRDNVQVFGDPAISNTVMSAVAQASYTYTDDLVPIIAYDEVGSDHMPFLQAGIPACLLTERGPTQNPYFHTMLDSVDTPGYINYAYGVQLTRIVVGLLVDQAGITPEADLDGDGDVDSEDYGEFDTCFAGSDVPVDPPCEVFDLDRDGDVDCMDWRLFEAAWTELGGPPALPACALLPLVVENEACRCLAMTPAAFEWPVALLLSGDEGDPTVSCVSMYVQSDGRLDTGPVFRTAEAWGTTVVCDEGIVPEANYDLRYDYGEPGSPVLTPPVVATAARWGDTVGDFIAGEWTPPNGTVDFNDISSVVDAFRHLSIAPPAYRVALVGPSGGECHPNLDVDFLDISAAVEAFKGKDYWETTSCPSPCE